MFFRVFTFFSDFQKHGWTPEEAVEFMRQKRAHILLHSIQWEALHTYHTTQANGSLKENSLEKADDHSVWVIQLSCSNNPATQLSVFQTVLIDFVLQLSRTILTAYSVWSVSLYVGCWTSACWGDRKHIFLNHRQCNNALWVEKNVFIPGKK